MRPLFSGALACAATAASAAGDVLISNISAPLSQAGTFFGSGSGTVTKAVGFTIGTQPYTLDTVRLSMNYGGGGAAVVSIWTGPAFPEVRLRTLISPPQIGSGNFSFTPGPTLTLNASTTYWVSVESVANPTGSFIWEGTSPATAPTGTATFVRYLFNGSVSGTYNRIEVLGTGPGPACYPNCDGSSVAPVLTANDFACFINNYAGSTAYANCDGSTIAPVLTANDFQCFINKYVGGCS